MVLKLTLEYGIKLNHPQNNRDDKSLLQVSKSQLQILGLTARVLGGVKVEEDELGFRASN